MSGGEDFRVAGGQDAARKGGVEVAAVEDEVVHVFAKAVQIEQAGGIDRDIRRIGKLTAGQVAHDISIFRQLILADRERSVHGGINDRRGVFVQQEHAVLHNRSAGVGVDVGAGEGKRAAAEFGKAAGATDLAAQEQRT